MKPVLIILRGNSGSGKSATARALQQRLGYGTALVEQDYIRRILLREKDLSNQPNIELIALNVRYALTHGYHVILEGILNKERYGSMIQKLMSDHDGLSLVYYFDISFDETLKRHATKPNAHEFGEPLMRKLFTPHDVLGSENEHIVSEDLALEQIVSRIVDDIAS
jgi:hypothetical protein